MAAAQGVSVARLYGGALGAVGLGFGQWSLSRARGVFDFLVSSFLFIGQARGGSRKWLYDAVPSEWLIPKANSGELVRRDCQYHSFLIPGLCEERLTRVWYIWYDLPIFAVWDKLDRVIG